jgi:hypothetical protein
MLQNNIIKFINETPFQIFEIEKFLDFNFYNNLLFNIPDPTSFDKKDLVNFKNNKFAITSDQEIYKDIIKQSNILNDFHNFVIHGNLIKNIYYSLYLKVLRTRGFDLRHIIKLFKIPRFSEKLNKGLAKNLFNIFNNMRITIQFSYISNNGYIVPHQDAGDKLLTLMLYFPSQNGNNFSNIEKEYGTTFWKTNFKNQFDGKHLEAAEEKNIFYKNSGILYKSFFKSNTLVGFVRNKYSWHTVEPVNVFDGYIRKSININIYY